MGSPWVEAVAALAPLDADVKALHVDAIKRVLSILGSLLGLVLDERVATLSTVKEISKLLYRVSKKPLGVKLLGFSEVVRLYDEITYVAFDVASAESVEVLLQLKRLNVLGNVSYEQTHSIFFFCGSITIFATKTTDCNTFILNY